MTVTIDRTWVESRFDGRREIPQAVPMPQAIEAERGDHDLNEGMAPVLPMKPAAVLIPLIDRPDEMTVLFTQRTTHLANHAGQISFPGGQIEPGDGGPAATALRETEDEIGLERRFVRLIGHLDTYVTRTGFIVTPVVGIVSTPFRLAPDPFEVAEVFEVPLSYLLDPRNHERCTARFEGTERHFYAIRYGRHFIWGATAGMLINFYDIVVGQR